MECRIEYKHLRGVRHNGCATLYAHKVRTCVKRSKVAAEFKLFKNFGGYKAAFKEIRTAMHHAVTYGFNLAHIFYATEFGIC